MGKQGPCYHCGVTSTPLWRNGPPEKPVLCNACGSRWRTKGTLANYTPLHARADSDVLEDHRAARMKTISLNKNKEAKLLKRKPNHDSLMVAPSYGQGTRKVVDEDTSNRSSSGSAISNSESCAQFGSADGSDLTGPAQSNVWETMVPSKKRTCFNRPKQSSVEKLTKDLHTILHQQQQSSYFSGSSEEDLLFESETPMVSVEIGHGSVLIRHPSSLAREEESEASSLSVENKHYALNEAYSHYMLPVNNEGKGANFSIYPSGRQMQAEPPRRDKPQHETLQILGCQSSPLCNIDLNDILNYEEFVKHLTIEEQVQLLNYLPQVDNTEVPQSLNSLFDSPQFKENLSSFQQLLGEGIFDFSFAEVKTEDCKALRRLALFNLTKSHWVEKYQFLKENTAGESFRGMKNSLLNNSVNMKRSCDIPGQKLSEAKSLKSPKRLVMKASCENKEVMDNDGSCFSPTSLFSFPPEGGSLMLDPSNFVDESSDQDLLLDVPSNGSFAEAELLDPNFNFGRQASASSSSSYRHLTHP